MMQVQVLHLFTVSHNENTKDMGHAARLLCCYYSHTYLRISVFC